MEKSEKDYFDDREPDIVYVSKTFSGFGQPNFEKRFIQRVFAQDENQRIEKVKVTGEYILRSSPTNKTQIKLLVIQDSKQIESFTNSEIH